MFKKSGNPKIEELTKSHKERTYNLTALSVIKIDNKRLCAWCGIGQLNHGNQKYCTDECRDSAWAWAQPQKEANLANLLIKQDYKCNLCRFDYIPFMDAIAARDNFRVSSLLTDWRTHYIWYYYKRLKDQVPQDRKPEVDHIMPIYKGGSSLGSENHQVICYTCHKEKTKKDLSGKRAKSKPDPLD